MHLHGEVIMRIDELDEQREVQNFRRTRAECIRARLRKPIRKSSSRRRTVCNDALAVLVTGELPTLGNFRQLRFLSVFISEPRAAPEIILQRCNEFHRIFHSSHPFSHSHRAILLNSAKNCKQERRFHEMMIVPCPRLWYHRSAHTCIYPSETE